MNDPRLGCLIKGGTNSLKGFRRVVLFSGAQELQVTALQGVELGFDAAVVQSFSGAAAHAAFS